MGLGAAVSLAISAWARIFGAKRLRFTYLTGQISDAEYQALAAKPGWAKQRITVAPGIGLNGLVRRATAANAPWVLFYQGNDAHMLRVGQAFLERLGESRDWGLAVFAYRGYDSSDGSARLSDLAADGPRILAELCKSENLDRERVHLVGFSIGGHLAARTMSAVTGDASRPASLSLLAAVYDIVMVPRSFYERFDPGDELKTEPFLQNIPAPVLVVQGTSDEALEGPAQGRAIAAKLGARAQYVELPGAGHVELLRDAAAIAATQEFIAAHAKSR